jgi:hypothetical protein
MEQSQLKNRDCAIKAIYRLPWQSGIFGNQDAPAKERFGRDRATNLPSLGMIPDELSG